MGGERNLDEVNARIGQLELTLLEVVTALGMLVGEFAQRDDLVFSTAGTAEQALEDAWQTLLGVPGPQEADLIAGDAGWADPARLADLAPVTLRRAMEDTGASVGAMYAIGEEEARLLASFGYPDAVMEAFRSFPLDSDLPVARAAQSRNALWFGAREEIVESYPHLAEAHEETEVALGEAAVQGAVMPLLADGRVAAVVILGFTMDAASRDPARLRALRRQLVDAFSAR
jgi:hypothetical protein